MSATSAERYRARFRKVLDYIEANLAEDLTVDRLGSVAAFSKSHFHRQFSALYGMNVHRYVQLRRLRRASYQLAFRQHAILEIALCNGYEGPEAFSRAFKKAFGQSPSEFRRQPEWRTWHSAYLLSDEMRIRHMKPAPHPEQVEIVHFDETRVAVLEHRGDPQRLSDSIRNFIAWRKEHGLPPSVSATFNVLYDDPDQIAPEDFRFDLCAAVDQDVAENRFGVVNKTLPGGRCAMLRHIGSDDLLGDTVRYLYLEWLPASGEEPRDFPLFLQRVRFFPDVPESEAVTDVYLPLEPRGAAASGD